jgi:hypothetical protein
MQKGTAEKTAFSLTKGPTVMAQLGGNTNMTSSRAGNPETRTASWKGMEEPEVVCFGVWALHTH